MDLTCLSRQLHVCYLELVRPSLVLVPILSVVVLLVLLNCLVELRVRWEPDHWSVPTTCLHIGGKPRLNPGTIRSRSQTHSPERVVAVLAVGIEIVHSAQSTGRIGLQLIHIQSGAFEKDCGERYNASISKGLCAFQIHNDHGTQSARPLK